MLPSRRRFLSALPALAAVVLSACEAWRGPLRVGANLWSGYVGLRMVDEARRLPQLRVLDMVNSSAVLAAFRNGLLDAAALTLDETLQLAAAEVPIRAVLVFDVSMGGDAIVGRPGVRTVYDLAGARVGVETEALGAYVVSRALDLAGLRVDSVDIVTLAPERQEAAFTSGKVDAVVTFEPLRSRLLALGGRELFSSRQIPGEIVDVLVIREDLPEGGRAVVQQLVNSYFATLPEVLAAPEHAARVLGARAGLDGPGLRAALKNMVLPDLAGNRAMLGQGEGSLAPTLKRLKDLLNGRGLLPLGAIEVDRLLDPSFVNRVAG